MITFWKQFCVIFTIVLFSCPVDAKSTKNSAFIFVSAANPIIVKDPSLAHAKSNPAHSVEPILADPHEANILPHRATYAISLDKAFDPEIRDVTGTMTLQILDTEDGWTYEQHAVMMIYDQEGNADQVMVTVASWESKDGLRYRFNSRVLRNGEEEQAIRGEALLATPQGEGIVTYQLPYEITLHLPVGTAFPIGHMGRLMQAAVKGDRVCSQTIFDGSSDTHDYVSVNTVITPWPKASMIFSESIPFPKDHVWLMHLAVFNPNDPEGGPEPDYEISQKVLPHGIIASMGLNYGDFEAQLTLTELEFFQ